MKQRQSFQQMVLEELYAHMQKINSNFIFFTKINSKLDHLLKCEAENYKTTRR